MSLSNFFLYLFYFCIISSYITFLLIVNPQDIPVDTGITIKLIPVRDRVIEVDVVEIITIVSNGIVNVVSVLYFLYFFLDILFLSLKYVIIFLMLLIWLSKLLTLVKFFFSRCSVS